MGMLSRDALRDAILAAGDILTEPVEVPEWGVTVLVRGMTGTERDAFESAIVERRGRSVRTNTANIRAKLVAQCVVDDAGARVFQPEDVEALGGKSARALDRIFDVAMRLSGLAAEDVEELAKNSGSDQSDSSISV